LYHGFGVRGYTHGAVGFGQGKVAFRVEQQPDTFRCADCGSAEVTRAGVVPRRLRSLPIGNRPVWIELPVQRLACVKTRQAEVAFADARRGYTRAFQRYALDLTLSEVEGDSGAVVFVGTGQGADAPDSFWRRLQASHARIRAVATDMSPAYTAAVRDHLPKATHVFDRFHVVKLFNEKLSLLRQAVQREAEGPLQKKVLPFDSAQGEGRRWLLLKNPENLTLSGVERDERKRLERALALNKPLATAYYMKEDLRQIWEQPDARAAAAFIDDWVARARASGIRVLQQFAQTIVEHRGGILNYYKCPITTAELAGTNNKIRTMQRQGVRLPRPGVLPPQDLRPARDDLRISRMNRNWQLQRWSLTTGGR
jgi:transposase